MDYISREAAIKEILDLHDCYNGFSDTYDKACIVGALEEVPAADVRKNDKRGWRVAERHIEGMQTIYWHECPKCGGKPLLNEWSKERELSNFCPHCGANLMGELERGR